MVRSPPLMECSRFASLVATPDKRLVRRLGSGRTGAGVKPVRTATYGSSDAAASARMRSATSRMVIR